MTTAFSGPSRLINLREKKNQNQPTILNQQGQLKLTLPQQPQKNTYEPSSSTINSRTSMRMFKGKIERNQSNDKQDIKSTPTLQFQLNSQTKLYNNPHKQTIKLVINDQPIFSQTKLTQQPTTKTHQKKIMISKLPTKQQQPISLPSTTNTKANQPNKSNKIQPTNSQNKIQKIQTTNKQTIKQQQMQQSQLHQPQSENDLLLCPQGCGRKFNRKALQKHAKACKIVFMSKRKQFNSQAKRLTSKQQANLIKQNKLKQKQLQTKNKSKPPQKNDDNWKVASQDFRSALKAIKKDDIQHQQQPINKINNQQQISKQPTLQLVPCKYCQKKFAQILLDKHLENCFKNKDKDKKKYKKK